MLNKIAAHPTLQHDGDLKIFLESESFTMDVKNKENREPDLGQSKGMFSSLGISVGGGGKFIEHDDVCFPPICVFTDLFGYLLSASGSMIEKSTWTLLRLS